MGNYLLLIFQFAMLSVRPQKSGSGSKQKHGNSGDKTTCHVLISYFGIYAKGQQGSYEEGIVRDGICA